MNLQLPLMIPISSGHPAESDNEENLMQFSQDPLVRQSSKSAPLVEDLINDNDDAILLEAADTNEQQNEQKLK